MVVTGVPQRVLTSGSCRIDHNYVGESRAAATDCRVLETRAPEKQ